MGSEMLGCLERDRSVDETASPISPERDGEELRGRSSERTEEVIGRETRLRG